MVVARIVVGLYVYGGKVFGVEVVSDDVGDVFIEYGEIIIVKVISVCGVFDIGVKLYV